MPEIITDKETREQFMYITINGRLIPENNEDYMKLCLLAYRFKQAVKHGINLVLKKVPQREAYKELAKVLPSSIYGETAYKYAKLLVEGSNGSKINIKRKWIASRGGITWRGNLNIKLLSTNEVLIRYYNGEWLRFKVRFGKKYLSLINELIELANQRKISYGISISFRNSKSYIHVEVPLQLYLKHFSTPKLRGYRLLAGFDLNSDRVNVVIIDADANIVAMRTFWYSEVVSHGFSKEKAKWLRLNALSKALKWCVRMGVDYVVFEDLTKIKHRRFTNNPYANRKIARFPKKQLLRHGMIKALKLGFIVILVNPAGTSNSLTHKQVMKEKGLDRHMASAYIIAYRGLRKLKEQGPSITPST
jgi:IS605 OrfB family transposase